MAGKTTIEITEGNYCKVTVENENGIKSNKHITFDVLFSLLSASLSEEKFDNTGSNIVLSDILPGDDIVSTIQVKEILSSKSKWYVLLRERKPADMKISGRTHKNVAMPRTLYAIKVCNGKCVSLRIGCVKNGPILMDSPIYKYPYSNVFDTQSVCLGSNSISDFIIQDLSNIVMIPEMFLAMINNNHGYNGSNNSGLDYEDLLELMAGAKFDDSILTESYNTKTYKEFIDKLR